MPNFIFPLSTLSPDDADQLGENFAKLSPLRDSLPKGFVVGKEAFQETFSNLVPLLLASTANQNKATDKSAFLDNLKSLVMDKFSFDPKLLEEVQKQSRSLNYPLLIKNQVTQNNLEISTFETIIFSQKELLPTFKAASLSFLNVSILSEVTQEKLQNLSQAILIMERPVSEVSGRVLVTTGQNGKIRLYSQWGEYHPNWTSDLSVFSLSSLEEESYDQAWQERQVILKNGKYLTTPVAKNFQFVPKLTKKQAETLAQLAKKLTTSLYSNIELRFSIVDSRVSITEILHNQDQAPGGANIPLLDYLTLYKKLSPLVTGIRSGPLRKIVSKKDLKKLRRGEIAALSYFDKKILPNLRKASAIIFENSKDLGGSDLQFLKKLGKTTLAGQLGQLRNRVVTVDGRTGKLYYGSFPPPFTRTLTPTPETLKEVETRHATALLVRPHSLAELKQLQNDGVSGFIFEYNSNAEKLLLESGHQHKLMILEADERNLKTAALTVAKLRHKEGLTNLHFCLPSATTSAEFVAMKKTLSTQALSRGGSFKLFSKIDTPASALSFQDVVNSGLDGAVIDYFTLVNKTYGKEFSFRDISQLEDRSISILLTQILNVSLKYNLYTVVTNIPIENALLKNLLSRGLKAVAAQSADLEETRRKLAEVEKDILTSVS